MVIVFVPFGVHSHADRATAEPLPGDPRDPRGFWSLLQQNVVWLRVHNYSPATIVTHEKYVRMFLRWAAERDLREPTQVTKPMLEAFQRHLFHYRKADGQWLDEERVEIKVVDAEWLLFNLHVYKASEEAGNAETQHAVIQ
ncbi:MAG: hypothetical protein FJ247_13895, partial [Nitrospira sp.]|nr:hypothetical protein [Nitrospira sp.]